MEKKYIIGVDEGSQSAKISVFDFEGNRICEGREPLRPYHLPNPGIVEHPDDDWWDAICAAGKKCMENFPGRAEEIAGLGLCTIRFCRDYMKADGTLAQPAMSWMDIRVSKPYEDTNKDIAYATASSGYITHRLTGNLKDSAANYLGMWPLDTDTWEWLEDEEAFQAYGYRRDMLPELVKPGDLLGHITSEAAKATGFPEGLPVFATANDQAAGALGSGCKGSDTAFISLGTYIPCIVQGPENPKNSRNFWVNLACRPNEYLYEGGGIRRGMWTISWFRDVLGDSYAKKAEAMGLSAEEYMGLEAAEVPAGSDGLMTVMEFLAPTDQLYKKGMMIGFDGRHGRAHMYRSILEGIAMTMKTNVDAMCEELGIQIKELIIAGGGAGSDLFLQIFADVFGIPVRRNKITGAAGVGAAICAAVGLNIYPSFDEAIDKMVKVGDIFEPDPEHVRLYADMIKIYREVTNYTDPLLERTYQIFN